MAISGDIKYLICHVTSPNHMLEGSCNFMCENFSCMAPPWWLSLVAIGMVIVEMSLVCHVI